MIEAYLEEQLTRVDMSLSDFSSVLIRLLDYGVISRDESQTEAALYDLYMQCADLVEDYLRVLNVRVQHDRQFAYVRLYPPGAVVPGMPDQDDTPFNSGFRSKPSQQEVAVMLVLRAEYEKNLREGQIDEKGRAMLSVEGLAIAIHNLLQRSLPEGQVERRALFRRLRQLRLIEFNTEQELESDESWLSIHPSITSFVSDEVLSMLLGDQQEKAADEPEDTSRSDSGSMFTNDTTTDLDVDDTVEEFQ